MLSERGVKSGEMGVWKREKVKERGVSQANLVE